MVESMANVELNTEYSEDIEYPSEATVGDQSLRAIPKNSPSEPNLPLPSPVELRRDIAQLAYEFYLRRGRLSGHDLDDWLDAERIVLSRFIRNANQTGDSPHAKKTR
jgi:DUF2934 family protein